MGGTKLERFSKKTRKRVGGGRGGRSRDGEEEERRAAPVKMRNDGLSGRGWAFMQAGNRS